ncbi:hypothetical protein [Amycolatopsis sp.]|uniref:hypothetical protein n=1 Tax=Amycolatopsis sp. TaxID=37632 RepID=UPI002D807E67|nr:hypothetical protein [Amycolatopsis sp.]HET6704564.1 hypothetical protein [Amycolatopsis sp.]
MAEENRFAKLPERVKPEDMVTTQAVDPAFDGTPEVDLERHWAAQEQGRLG